MGSRHKAIYTHEYQRCCRNVVLFREVLLPLAPEAMRQQVHDALPMVGLLTHQLGVEILVAEAQGIRFIEAVDRPDFLKMGRVYFGAINLLQYEVPDEIVSFLKRVLKGAANGDFEPIRKLLFIVARRTSDPQAAVCRFLLWIGIQLNLKIATWDKPGVEARGTLAIAAAHSQDILFDFLGHVPDEWFDEEFRPIHVVFAETFLSMVREDDRVQAALIAFGANLEEMISKVEGIELHRRLEARAAVVVDPSAAATQMGSQRLVDRYPQHFQTANALDQHRSRLRKDPVKGAGADNRFIDIVRNSEEYEGDE